MRVAVIANPEQKQELLRKPTNSGVELIFLEGILDIGIDDSFETIFLLREVPGDTNWEIFFGKHVFINSVTETLGQKGFPQNYSRVNGWPGFLERSVWEVASTDKLIASQIFDAIGWKMLFVNDEPGLVAARVIAVIINESYYALGEGVSTEEEIDLAMKMGTNYPLGPFEWAQKIGLGNICYLLRKLSEKDKRYAIAPLLSRRYRELSA